MRESPFRNRFGTNYAPSPPEIVKIRNFLDVPEKQLRALDEEIARLQAQRDELKNFIDNHHALLSPIRRVHTDILREIFVHCLPEDHLPFPNLREAPLLLTGICQRWQEVVISTPELWNRIYISLSFPQSPQGLPSFRPLMEKSAQGLEVWLGRSGSMPLTVSFRAVIPSMADYSQVGHIWHGTDSESLMELQALYVDFAQHLLRYSSRWKSITLMVANCIRDLFGRHHFERLDMLTEIKTIRPRDRSSEPTSTAHPLATLFKQSPSLRVLHLDEGFFYLPIRWENLTEMSLSQPLGREMMFPSASALITPSEFLRMLSLSCMSLRRCAANITLTTAVIHDTSLPIILPYLHTLKLNFAVPLMGHPQADATPSQLAFIFDALVAPALTHLYINVASSTVQPFINLLERSGCVLKSFEPHMLLSVDGLVEILRAMPYLSELTLSRTVVRQMNNEQESFTDFVSKWLTPSPDTLLLPQLENISFTLCAPSDAESLLAFAEARCASYDGQCRRLGKMTVSFVRFLTDEEIPFRLQRLRDRGLTVHWSSPQDTRGKLIRSDLWDGRASGSTDRSPEHIY